MTTHELRRHYRARELRKQIKHKEAENELLREVIRINKNKVTPDLTHLAVYFLGVLTPLIIIEFSRFI